MIITFIKLFILIHTYIPTYLHRPSRTWVNITSIQYQTSFNNAYTYTSLPIVYLMVNCVDPIENQRVLLCGDFYAYL